MELQITAYAAWMAVSAAAGFGLFGLFGLKGERDRLPLTGLSFLLGTAGGVLGAKAFYYLCQLDFMIAQGWLGSLLSLNPEELSFFGGAAGVCLGTALAARLRGRRPVEVLNLFAPFGLILGALARFGEYFLERVGIGLYLEDEAVCFFPLAVGFTYGDWTAWYLAVFVLEGITLLAAAAFSQWVLKEHRFLRSVFWLCLPQILLENLRAGSFMWFFCIRVEQLTCMVVMFVILVVYGVRSRGQPRRFLPAAAALCCAGVFVACEFAMEGKIAALHFLDLFGCYAVMFAGQAVLGVTETLAFRKMVRAEKELQTTGGPEA